MKKTAVLIDAGFLRVKIRQDLKAKLRQAGQPIVRADGSPKQDHDLISAAEYVARVVKFANGALDKNAGEELYRIFYYDCPPYTLGPSPIKPHPMGIIAPIVEQAAIDHQNQVLERLRKQPFLAVRTGELSFDGWLPLEKALANVIQTGRAFVPADFRPVLRQKGIDLRIGVDTTSLARDGLIDRLVLVACDSDLVPAMKLARREGVQVVLVSLGAGVKKVLREHADIYRKPKF
jgi:uncharacterized LabA/DUF88 family protein